MRLLAAGGSWADCRRHRDSATRAASRETWDGTARGPQCAVLPPPVPAQYRTALELTPNPGPALMPREGCSAVAVRPYPGTGHGERAATAGHPEHRQAQGQRPPVPSEEPRRPHPTAPGRHAVLRALRSMCRHLRQGTDTGRSGGRAALNGLLVLRWQQGHHPPACGPGPGQGPRPREPQAGPSRAAPLRQILIGAAMCAGPGGT